MKEIKIIYTIKIKYVGNQTLDPIGGYYFEQDNIASEGIWNICSNELSSWQNYLFKGRNPYGYPKKTLGRNAHINHHDVVYCICHHMDYL